jgi:pantothenate kinase
MARDITAHVNALTERIYAGLENQPRMLVAIAGPPGSGKMTLAGELARRLRDQRTTAEVVPQDGFLLDNTVLDAAGLRGRKGAPETLDAAGYLHLIARLRDGEGVVAPLYDRARDIAIAGALIVPSSTRVVICTGPYLLFAEAPWHALAPMWDVTAQMQADLADLRARLIQRGLDHGLSRAASARRVETNDILNARRVQERALPADFLLISKAL